MLGLVFQKVSLVNSQDTLKFMADPFYQDASRGVSQMGQVANTIALGLARQRYQQEALRQQMALRQQQLQQQALLNQSRGNLMGAQTAAHQAGRDLDVAKTSEINQKMQSAGVFGDIIRDVLRNPQIQQDLLPLAAQEAARLSGMGQQHVPVNMAQLLQMANQRDRTLMATGARPIQSMPSQSIAMDVTTGNPSYVSPQKLTPGMGLYSGTGTQLALNPNRPQNPLQSLSALLGSAQNLRQQGIEGQTGDVVNPADPTFQAADQFVRMLMQQAQSQMGGTNAPALPTPPQSTARPGVPPIGTVHKGYRFKGGDPASPSSWEKVQ